MNFLFPKFNKKASVIFVAAGISFGANAGGFSNQSQVDQLQNDQFQEVWSQMPCEKKEQVELFRKKRCRDLGSRTTEHRVHVHQILYKHSVTTSDQTDTSYAELCKKEQDFPYEKVDPCEQQAAFADQLSQLQLKDVDGSEQQQCGSLARTGHIKTDKTRDHRDIFRGEATQTEYWDSVKKTRTTTREWQEEETWNSFDSDSEDESPEQEWKCCGDAKQARKGK